MIGAFRRAAEPDPFSRARLLPGRDAFMQDAKTQDAIIRNLQVMGVPLDTSK
jgi:hypothetical protein